MVQHETVTVVRDCDATVVPAGTKVVIPEGTEVTITQTLGGSYSVITDRGFMARVEAVDADALGKEAAPETPKTAPVEQVTDPETMETLVWDQLRSVYDPEIPVNIVDLGLVYKCDVAEADDGYRVEVEMTMTAPGCGMG
ncbi:MAG: DUF59 domain-containing protein, partial [Candidatus Eisenbacteria bacterium]|nr:DUF59 domain-containing protein [Candidatus Eisenbacteria bacterium]